MKRLAWIAVVVASALVAAALVWTGKQSKLRKFEVAIAGPKEAPVPVALQSVPREPIAAQLVSTRPLSDVIVPSVPANSTKDSASISQYGLIPTEAEAKAQTKVRVLHGAFLEHLSLTGRDPSQFNKLLFERELLISDIISTARAQGINPMDRGQWKPVTELVTKAVNEHNSQMKEAVGAGLYEEYRNWEMAKPERNIANEINRRVDLAARMTAEQQTEFIAILAQLRDASGVRKTANIPERETNIPVQVRIIPRVALERLSSVLTTPQMAKFAEIYAEQDRLPPGIVSR